MKYRMGAKAGRLVRVLAVIAIVMISAMAVLVSGSVARADAPVYVPSGSMFIYGGSEFPFMFYRADLGYYYLGGQNAWDMSGENDIDCGLYYVPVMDVNASVLYEHGQKAVVDGRFGSPIDYSESLFVPTDGVYAYQGDPAGWTVMEGEGLIAPPTLEIYIPLPVSGNRSVFKTPETNFSDTDTLYVYSSVAIPAEDTCLAWEAVWEEGYLYPPMPLMAGNELGEGGMGSVLARALLAYNTSSIPDDAVITNAYLRVIAYGIYSDMVEDYTFVVGGTHNTSLTPWYLGEGMPVVYYNQSEFYGDFADFNVSEFPSGFSYGNGISTDATFNNDGLGYINAGGFTVLSIRAESDINHICPLPNGSSFAGLWGVNSIVDGISNQPATLLVVDWYIPEEGGGLVSPQVAVMMDIMAILFLTGGIIGLLFVVGKNDGMSVTTKAGIVTTVAVMAVVGVIIIESLVVAFK